MTKDGEPTPAMVEAASEAIHDFLDQRFPDGPMPGGRQLFADDHLDAEFKHEAGCDELAKIALCAAHRAMVAASPPDQGREEKLEAVAEFVRKEAENPTSVGSDIWQSGYTVAMEKVATFLASRTPQAARSARRTEAEPGEAEVERVAGILIETAMPLGVVLHSRTARKMAIASLRSTAPASEPLLTADEEAELVERINANPNLQPASDQQGQQVKET